MALEGRPDTVAQRRAQEGTAPTIEEFRGGHVVQRAAPPGPSQEPHHGARARRAYPSVAVDMWATNWSSAVPQPWLNPICSWACAASGVAWMALTE